MQWDTATLIILIILNAVLFIYTRIHEFDGLYKIQNST